ncbi:MAG: hypothetical protein AABX07_00460 [Nanoarchaeota archaeon]
MNIIKDIFEGNATSENHGEFIKFSKGLFNYRYLIEAKKQKDSWAIKTGPEFVNSIVKMCLQKITDEVEVTGVIVSTFKIENSDLPIERIKQFMGVKQAVINAKIAPAKILAAMEKYPRAFFALSFSTLLFQLKVKAKAPKSAKPTSAGDKEPKAEFCSLKTSDASIVRDILFDVQEFKEVKVKHSITINEIILPTEVSDPVQLRELSKRKGVLKREVEVDGRKSVKEANFEV